MQLRTARFCRCFICLITALLLIGQCLLEAERLPTVAEKLREHHIHLSKDSLISALSNANPEVRYLAAEQLAEDKATGAIHEIEEALAVERVPTTKVNLAFSLALLHDKSGAEVLKSACTDPSFPSHLRLRAASYLLTLKDDGCFSSILSALKSSNDPEIRIGALSLATQLSHVSERDLQAMYPFILSALDDPTPAVRLSAGDVLATIGDTAAIPYLEHAIAIEKDQTIRSEMQTGLKQLKDKQKEQESQNK